VSGKVLASALGLLTVLFGVGALVFPQRVMDYAGFAVSSTASVAHATGEVRAVFGGLFVVLGAWILLAALREWRLVLGVCGSLFLGAAAGRLVGVYVEGVPGVGGWTGLLLEIGFGGGLLWSAWSLGRPGEEWEFAPTAGTAPTSSPSSVAPSPNFGQSPGSSAGGSSPTA